MTSVIEAYKLFDLRAPGGVKVEPENAQRAVAPVLDGTIR